MSAEIVDTIIGKLPITGSSTRLQVLFEHRETLEIGIQHWVDFSLKVGMPVTKVQLRELEKAGQESEGQEVAFRFLRFRPRTEYEVSQHLEKKGYDEEIRAAVLERLKVLGFLDDQQYAREFVQEKLSAYSRMELSWKLRRRGVESSIIEAVLGDMLSENVETRTALQLGRKQWRRYESKGTEECRVKVAQFLQRKGFSMGAIYSALAILVSDSNPGAHS